MFDYFNKYGGESLSNRQSNFNTIKDLIQDGMSEMRKNPTTDHFNIWFNYSQKILELCTKGNPSILLNYLRLGQSLLYINLQPYEKFSKCIDYLIEILENI